LGSVLTEMQERSSRRLFDQLMFSLDGNIKTGAELDVRRILQDPQWERLADAMIVSDNLEEVRGEVLHHGIAINPLGRVLRGGRDVDQEILRAMLEVIETKETVSAAGGWVVPIEDKRGPWGAFWYRLPESFEDRSAMAMILVGWLLVSTVLLTGGMFVALSKLFLDPVVRLTGAVRRMESGDLSSRVVFTGGSGELAELSEGFNSMATEVQGFNERLEGEVREATSQARTAEQAAMTQRRLAAMGEFAAGIAHEINNPLGGLINAVEVIGREGTPPDKQARYIALLTGGLERIRDTVGQLLRFTPRETEAVKVDLTDVARDSLGLVGHRASTLGVELVLKLDGEVRSLESIESLTPRDQFVVFGARNELGQALLNLLANALDALEEGRAAAGNKALCDRINVGLTSSSQNDGPTVTVVDNGPGVDAERLKRVADLFFTTKEVGKGTGLGLSIVHGIVGAHEGRVFIESEPGAGFRVRLEFPRPEHQAAGRVAPKSGKVFRPSHGPKIGDES
jgi:signal transduction histidine kinase